jgi:hypothetical protein
LPTGFWERVSGQFTQTIDQRKLADAIRESLDPSLPADMKFCLVTDQELTPPPEWRYLIWDDCSTDRLAGGVASLAPIDPAYWRIRDPWRVARIKHRIRTACLSMVAECSGSERCDDTKCFLFMDVESADRLDAMVRLAPGHPDLPELTGWGFGKLSDQPEIVEKPIYSGQGEVLA